MSLQQEIERLRNKTAQEETLGLIGRSLLQTPISGGVTQDNWKDALVASILKGVVGGGLAGMGQARADEQSQSLLAEALGAGGLREQFDAGQDIAESDYSPELAGIVGSIVGQKYDDERKLDLLDKQYEAQYGARAKYAEPKPTIADKIKERTMLEEALKKGGLGSYGRKPDIINVNSSESSPAAIAKDIRNSYTKDSGKKVEAENQFLSQIQRYNEAASKYMDDKQEGESLVDYGKRKFGELTGDADATELASSYQAVLNALIKAEVGTQTDRDELRKIIETAGGSPFKFIQVVQPKLNKISSMIQEARTKRQGVLDRLILIEAGGYEGTTQDAAAELSSIASGLKWEPVGQNRGSAKKPTISKESALAELKRRGVL